MNTLCFATDLSSIQLGDTVYSKPKITEYFYADNIDGLTAEAYLNDEQLNIEGLYKASDINTKTNYLFLVDESTSISSGEMKKIKEALRAAANNISGSDTMSIIAFGENTEVRADHTTDKAVLENAISTLNNNKEGTVFFDVIKKAGEICNTAPLERNLVFVISDGVDFNVGGYTYEEIQKYILEKDITIFAVALGDISDENIDRFGKLARSNNGFIEVCDLNNIDDNILSLMNRVKNSYGIVMNSKNNRVVSDTADRLTVNFSANGKSTSLEKSVASKKWIEDNEAPTIISAEQKSNSSILIKFSENVVNADITDNYKLLLSKRHELKADTVKYDETQHTAELVFEKGVFSGNYKISCVNITDDSMEQNPVSGEIEQQFRGRSYEIFLFENAATEYGLLILIFILIVAGIVAYAVINKRKGIVIHDKKVTFRDNIVEKERIITPQTTNISLAVTGPGGLNKKINKEMYKSIIVGRSDSCDISFSDNALSRQHFAIEENDGIFTITDLNTLNGTTVNGVRLTSRVKLENGDVIIAGNEKFVFNRN